MQRCSNTFIGFLNFITLLASLPIIGAGLWMSHNATTSCDHFLKTPMLYLGFFILILSLAGFVGSCFDVAWALWVYLFVMLFVIAALLGLTVFGLVVTGHGGGVAVPGKIYREYKLEDYSGWLRKRVRVSENWAKLKSCVVKSKNCAKIVSWTPLEYQHNNLSPIQSGCCKPPTACVYNVATPVAQDPDCYKWNNAPAVLCYDCDSCKAGVLETLRREWSKLSVLNITMVVLLIALYSVGCCAFQNAKRSDLGYRYYGNSRMSKIRPRFDSRWWR